MGSSNKHYQKNRERILREMKEKKASMSEDEKKAFLKKKRELYHQKRASMTDDQVQELNSQTKRSYADKIKPYREVNREKYLEGKKRYREKNKDKIHKAFIRWKKSKPHLILANRIRKSISQHFKQKSFQKTSSTQSILGCSFPEFKAYIESKFEPWMTWENRGKYDGTYNYGWGLDHIIPMASAASEEDVIRLNHHTNFQPLCSYINRYVKKDNLS